MYESSFACMIAPMPTSIRVDAIEKKVQDTAGKLVTRAGSVWERVHPLLVHVGQGVSCQFRMLSMMFLSMVQPDLPAVSVRQENPHVCACRLAMKHIEVLFSMVGQLAKNAHVRKCASEQNVVLVAGWSQRMVGPGGQNDYWGCPAWVRKRLCSW